MTPATSDARNTTAKEPGQALPGIVPERRGGRAMNSETKLQPWRLLVEMVPLSRRERLRVWWLGVLDAISASPPTERARQVKAMPGEPGFEDAWPMVATVAWRSSTSSIGIDRAAGEPGKEETK